MAISFETVYPEKARTSAPATSGAYDLASSNGNFVTATLSTLSTAGSVESTLTIQPQWSANELDWEDIPGSKWDIHAGYDGDGEITDTVIPAYETKVFQSKRKFLRFVPSVAGTTHAFTWRLELKFSSFATD